MSWRDYWIYKFDKSHPTIPFPAPIPGLYICNECKDTSQVNLHKAKSISICCMDFRLRDNINCNLINLGYKNKYDEFILAGASLGYIGFNGYNWRDVADDHIDLAHNLHDIEEVILIDHMKCGAYHAAYPDITLGGADEYNLHIENLNQAASIIQEKYPSYQISKYIISIDGGIVVDIDKYTGGFPF